MSDVARRLEISKPSVSVAVGKLKKEDILSGLDVLEKFGVDPQEAEAEACKFEHVMSDEAFRQLKFDTK